MLTAATTAQPAAISVTHVSAHGGIEISAAGTPARAAGDVALLAAPALTPPVRAGACPMASIPDDPDGIVDVMCKDDSTARQAHRRLNVIARTQTKALTSLSGARSELEKRANGRGRVPPRDTPAARAARAARLTATAGATFIGWAR